MILRYESIVKEGEREGKEREREREGKEREHTVAAVNDQMLSKFQVLVSTNINHNNLYCVLYFKPYCSEMLITATTTNKKKTFDVSKCTELNKSFLQTFPRLSS